MNWELWWQMVGLVILVGIMVAIVKATDSGKKG
jgi:hypothetical protein